MKERTAFSSGAAVSSYHMTSCGSSTPGGAYEHSTYNNMSVNRYHGAIDIMVNLPV